MKLKEKLIALTLMGIVEQQGKNGASFNEIVKAIDDYQIKKNNYDLVMEVSSLEHVDSKETFVRKL